MQRIARKGLVALALIAATSFILGAAAPSQGRSDDRERENQIVLSGRVEVETGERVNTIVIFDGPVRVDGRAERVYAFNGDVLVTGSIEDDVNAFNGRVTVTDGGRVGGDVVSSDRARISPGATVDGSIERFRGRLALSAFGVLAHFVIWLAVSVSLFALGALVLLLAPRGVEAVADAARTAVGPAIAWGIGLAIGLPIAGIIALFTIVGLPFGIGLLLSLAVLYPLGYVVGAFFLGRLLVRSPRSLWLAFLAGWAILRAVALVPVLGVVTWLVAAVYGLGALAVAIWRTRTGARPAPELAEPAPT